MLTENEIVKQTFEPDLSNVGKARLFVKHFCQNKGLSEEVAEIAVLLVSEVIANAFIHGKSSSTVTVEKVRRGLHLSVSDDKPQSLHVNQASEDSVNGRGLQILDFVAEHWEVKIYDSGKLVFFGVGCS